VGRWSQGSVRESWAIHRSAAWIAHQFLPEKLNNPPFFPAGAKMRSPAVAGLGDE
jgi:hypothetical protein